MQTRLLAFVVLSGLTGCEFLSNIGSSGESNDALLAGGVRRTYVGSCHRVLECRTGPSFALRTTLRVDEPTPFTTTLDIYDRQLSTSELHGAYPYQKVETGAVPVVPAIDAENAYKRPGSPATSVGGSGSLRGAIYQIRTAFPPVTAGVDEQVSYVVSGSSFESHHRVALVDPQCNQPSDVLFDSWICTTADLTGGSADGGTGPVGGGEGSTGGGDGSMTGGGAGSMTGGGAGSMTGGGAGSMTGGGIGSTGGGSGTVLPPLLSSGTRVHFTGTCQERFECMDITSSKILLYSSIPVSFETTVDLYPYILPMNQIQSNYPYVFAETGAIPVIPAKDAQFAYSNPNVPLDRRDPTGVVARGIPGNIYNILSADPIAHGGVDVQLYYRATSTRFESTHRRFLRDTRCAANTALLQSWVCAAYPAP